MEKIFHVVQHLQPGGLEVLAVELSRLQNNQDFQNHFFQVGIISLQGDKEEALSRWERLQSIKEELVFFGKKPGISIKLIKELYGFFKKEKVSCINTHHIGPLLYAGIAGRLAGIKVVHTEHDAWHLQNAKRRFLMKILLRFIKPILVADAHHVAQKMTELLNIDDPKIIQNGIDVDRFVPLLGQKLSFKEKLGLPLDVIVVGVSARLETVKGVDVAIKAIKQLPKNYHLAIAGIGSQKEELEKLVIRLKLQDRVHFLGLVNDMVEFYNSLDVLCVPSRDEGLPLSPLEAQSCGIPVVATRVGGTASAICPKTGELAQSENPDNISHLITQVLWDAPEVSPRNFVLEHGNLKNVARKYLGLYNPRI